MIIKNLIKPQLIKFITKKIKYHDISARLEIFLFKEAITFFYI